MSEPYDTYTKSIHHDTYPAIAKSDHRGRTVFITGASGGLGHAVAIAFAKAGAAHIFIAARSNLDDLEQRILSVASAAGFTPRVHKLAFDITVEEDVDAAIAVVREEVTTIDVLYNNAGQFWGFKPLLEKDQSGWWRTWEVNVKGMHLVTHALLPLVLQSELKTIINVSSIGALKTTPGCSGYQGSKLAMVRYAEFLDVEHRHQGLVAFAIHPGAVLTQMALQRPGPSLAALRAGFPDKPELVADTVTWLTQERREWLSGRFVDVRWDMPELLAMKEDIIKCDKLKVRIVL